jgi:hypothetical protein
MALHLFLVVRLVQGDLPERSHHALSGWAGASQPFACFLEWSVLTEFFPTISSLGVAARLALRQAPIPI